MYVFTKYYFWIDFLQKDIHILFLGLNITLTINLLSKGKNQYVFNYNVR